MRDPKCPYFGKCGGCATQHLPYELQLENKKKRAEQVLQTNDIQVFSGEEFWYRNRMDMVFTKEGIGFREKGSWKWKVDVEQCVISNKKLNQYITEVRDEFGAVDPFNQFKRIGTYKYAVIRTPQNDSSISFVVNKESTRLSEATEKIKAFAEKSSVKNVLITYVKAKSSVSIAEDYVVIKGSDMLEETLLGKTFRYSVQGFFQNNHFMTERMHEYIHEKLKTYSDPEGHLLDLYGGVGTFGVINAELFKGCTTVEDFEGCTVAAKDNIELNSIKNMEAINLDAKQLSNLKLPEPLYVITDPPRSGMHPKTIQRLLKIKPKVILYISCNIKQLEKDMPKFLTEYELKSSAVFDLFPQTNHMETVVEMLLKS